MKETQLIMGMPITIMSPDQRVRPQQFKKIFDFFRYVDQTYSPYIETSDVSKINRGELGTEDYSHELRDILTIADTTKEETRGYFDVWHDDVFDPSGIVKGWSIDQAAKLMCELTKDFYIEAGGDIQVNGVNDSGGPWRIGIRNPYDRHENIAVVSLENHAIATSGTTIRGQHIYDPVHSKKLTDVVSLSVIAPNIVDADRMATAAFAMGPQGIDFIESLDGYEGYMVGENRMATMTNGWKEYAVES